MVSWRFNVACVMSMFLVGILPTQAADPVLERLEPQGGQRGTQVTVQTFGQRLNDGPYQVLLYEAGIKVVTVQAVNGKQVKCVLRLDDDCRLGRHALRLRTASGLSNLVTFHVGNLKEIKEVEPYNQPATPQVISTGVVVNGVILEGDIDVFAVDLAKGERLSVEIEGLRLGRTLFDPLLELRDASQKLLASSDDQPAAHQDAFLSRRATQAERVFIWVRDSAHLGDDKSTYRLHVGRFPRPTALFPPVVVPGKPAQVRWFGPTFDDSTLSVEVPEASHPIYELHAVDAQGISPSGLPIYLARSDPSSEVEPNNNQKSANELSAPGIAYGVIGKPKDRDFFRFAAKKGQVWELRVRARTLRSPLDAVLHLYDPQGKYLQGNDDDSGQLDSFLRFKVPTDGDYTLDVEDRMLRGTPEMVYVVEIAKPSPVAEMQLEERRRYQAQVLNIPQGGRTAAMVSVKRKNFGGPLQLEFDGLPAGSQAQAVALAKNYNRVPVLFTADPQAELSATLATLTARLTKKPRAITSRFRQQTWLVRGRNNVPFWSHRAERAPVAVTQALPYSIRGVQPKAPLVQGGSIELKIIAERDDGFENAIAVRTLYNPPGVSTNQSRSIRKNELEAKIPITANAKARTGEWQIVFLGKTSINGNVESSTQLMTLQIVQPFFDLKIPSLTVHQGETVEMTVALEHRSSFSGEAELELLRLPAGVTAKKTIASAGEDSVTFQLQVAKDARVGRHRGVACQVKLTVNDESVAYRQGYVDLCVDPAPNAKTAAQKDRTEGQTS